MTSRERLLTVINGEIPDRVPVAPFIQQEFMSEYLKKGGTDRLIDACTCADELGFDLMTRQNVNSKPYFIRKSFPNWEVNESKEIKNGNHYKITTIKTPMKTLEMIEGAPYKKDILEGIHYLTTKFMIESEEDFEIFAKYLPKDDGGHKREIIENGKYAREYIGERGLNSPWSCGGVFNLACTFMNIQEMLMDAICDEEYYCEYMDFFTNLMMYDAECYIESEYDIVGMQGNMANGGLMKEDHFRSHVMPYEKKICSFLKDNGKPVLYHNCGRAMSLLPCYTDMGLTVYETLAAAPEGDTDLLEAKKLFEGTGVTLMGTFDQVNFLKQATPDEVYRRAAEIMSIGKKGGRYIFAASDYIEVGTPIDNFMAFIEGAVSESAY